MKTEHQRRVEKFMQLAGQEVPTFPTIPSPEVAELRARLILEEAIETISALGVAIYWEKCCLNPFREYREKDFQYKATDNPDLVSIIDGCCDIRVVTTGTLSALGIPDELFQEEVDHNNLSKFGPGGYRDVQGKWIKPPDHQPPKINSLLKLLTGDTDAN